MKPVRIAKSVTLGAKEGRGVRVVGSTTPSTPPLATGFGEYKVYMYRTLGHLLHCPLYETKTVRDIPQISLKISLHGNNCCNEKAMSL